MVMGSSVWGAYMSAALIGAANILAFHNIIAAFIMSLKTLIEVSLGNLLKYSLFIFNKGAGFIKSVLTFL